MISYSSHLTVMTMGSLMYGSIPIASFLEKEILASGIFSLPSPPLLERFSMPSTWQAYLLRIWLVSLFLTIYIIVVLSVCSTAFLSSHVDASFSLLGLGLLMLSFMQELDFYDPREESPLTYFLKSPPISIA